MAKNRNKKNKSKMGGASSMEICAEAPADIPQPMDASEAKASNPTLGAASRKMKKGVAVRRAKNLRKQKALERAISNSEKLEEKASKSKDKTLRIQFAKSLYD